MDNISGEHSDRSAGFHKGMPFHPHTNENQRRSPSRLSMMAADAEDYAGDVSPSYAYDVLKAEKDAVLVDVRTKPEWTFVGIPDLSALGKTTGFIEWLRYPEMAVNELFLTDLSRFVGESKEMAVFFLCRSGQRSQKAAIAATAQGYKRAYNIEGGFEGSLDAERHRGRANGWKAAGLPWAQT